MQQKAALKTVEEFLGSLQKSVSSPGASRAAWANSDAMVMFSRQGKGVTLLNDEAIEYGTVADNVYGSLTDERRLVVSRKVIEGLLQEAIITALFIPPDDPVERLNAAIKSLSRGLSQREVVRREPRVHPTARIESLHVVHELLWRVDAAVWLGIRVRLRRERLAGQPQPSLRQLLHANSDAHSVAVEHVRRVVDRVGHVVVPVGDGSASPSRCRNKWGDTPGVSGRELR